MPDHLHALAAGTSEAADVMKFATVFRQQTGQAHRQRHEHRLWQEGFVDKVLRDEDSTFDVASYILANPVRAGLCADAMAYPNAGSSRYSLEEIGTYVQWRPDSLG